MTVILHQPPAPRERVSRPPTISPEKARCHELSIENLKISAPRGEKYSYPTARHEPLQRYRFIEILDPNLNVCIEADSVKDISLDYVAEVTLPASLIVFKVITASYHRWLVECLIRTRVDLFTSASAIKTELLLSIWIKTLETSFA